MDMEPTERMKVALKMFMIGIGFTLVEIIIYLSDGEFGSFWSVIIAIGIIVSIFGFVGNTVLFFYSLGSKTMKYFFHIGKRSLKYINDRYERDKIEINKKISKIEEQIRSVNRVIGIAKNQTQNESIIAVIKYNNTLLDQLISYLDKYESILISAYANNVFKKIENREIERIIIEKENVNMEYKGIINRSIINKHPILNEQYNKIKDVFDKLITKKLVQATNSMLSKESPISITKKKKNIEVNNLEFITIDDDLNNLNYEYDRYAAEIEILKDSEQ
jgi:hypothetical protein